MFSQTPEIQALKNKLHELSDLSSAGAVLAWDQETYMPMKGAQARGYQMATLAGVAHEKLIDKQVGELIEAIKRLSNLTDWDRALVREMERAYERATKLPTGLVRDISVATSAAFAAWRKAKENNDFASYVPALQRILELKVKAAELLKKDGESVYDTMLDEFEPGLTEAGIEKIFGSVRERLSDLAIKLAKKTRGADEVIKGKQYDEKEVWDLSMQILADMGYDLEAGRQDISPHPFTITFGVQDVRITTWKDKGDPRPTIFATIHEGGHALYEQGVDLGLDRMYLGETGGLSGGTGLAMHESQSRLWENMVGRSQAFWEARFPQAQQAIQAFQAITLDQWVRAINVVKPSLIRVEADEVTYGLHIMARFELEQQLVSGKLAVKDLPAAWNGKYQELLGITPPTDREGVLQDVHWSHGSFGYFPTYLLGSMISAQLWHFVPEEIKRLRNEDIKKLREWLRVNIHQFGRVYSSGELLKKVTGEDLNSNYYLEYLANKFKKLYN